MARVELTPQDAPGSYPALQPAANSLDLIETAADATNKEQFTLTGRELLIAHNTGAGARTVTITSVADDKGRSGDITTYSIDAGEIAIFGPFKREGWAQTNGKLYIEASHAEVKWGVVRLPSIS